MFKSIKQIFSARNKDVRNKILESVLEHCNEQAEYYRTIAYRSDYKDETVSRIVNLGIAYEDVSKYIELLILKSQYKVQLTESMNGDPTSVGQALDLTNTTTKTEQETNT